MAREEMGFSFFRCVALCCLFSYLALVQYCSSAAAQRRWFLVKRNLFPATPSEREGEGVLLQQYLRDQRCGNQPNELQNVIPIATFIYLYNTISSLFYYLYSLNHRTAQEKWKKATRHFEGKSLYEMCEWNKGQDLLAVQFQKESIWHFTCQEATLTNINCCWELLLQV